MAWLALARALAGLALALLGAASRRGSLDPEAAAAARRPFEEALDALDKALAARRDEDRAALRDPDRLRADDGYRRD